MSKRLLTFFLTAVSFALPINCAKKEVIKPQGTPYIHEEKQIMYSCPMHPDAISTEPGFCPKCRMRLEEKGKERKAIYACPMKCHPSDVPGRCPKCGMKMRELKTPSQ